ncbi:hypothetical protein D3C80_484430 [compost metagenome]
MNDHKIVLSCMDGKRPCALQRADKLPVGAFERQGPSLALNLIVVDGQSPSPRYQRLKSSSKGEMAGRLR